MKTFARYCSYQIINSVFCIYASSVCCSIKSEYFQVLFCLPQPVCQSEIICISENLSTNKQRLFTTVTHSSKSLFSFAIARRGKVKAQKSKITTQEWIDEENIYHQANDIPLPLLFIILSSTQ